MIITAAISLILLLCITPHCYSRLSRDNNLSLEANCTCSNQKWCEPIALGDKVVLGFITSKSNYEHYEWDKITTIALFFGDPIPSELVCFAHSKNVSVIIPPKTTKQDIFNATVQQVFIRNIVNEVKSNFIDGVNFDYEQALSDEDAVYYTKLVENTNKALKEVNQLYQVSVDVAWSAECIDGRCYDAYGLSQVSDYLVIMAYDEQSQMSGPPCYTKANSPFNQTLKGIQSYELKDISHDKLVLGLPWYGYVYKCINNFTGEVCQISEAPFRGFECSDAAGSQWSYAGIMDHKYSYNAEEYWDKEGLSPYLIMNMNETIYQIYYDDPVSLSLKYMLADKLGLKGLAIWTLDCLNYTSTQVNNQLRSQMWDAFNVFLAK